MKNKPNFFIVGAPKCGTTALSEYLKEHPNVFMSPNKEPHYFAFDMVKYRKFKTKDEYLDLFKNATDKHVVIGEASVWYLYSQKAIEKIYHFDKNAKIIIMLRKPVDMVYSMHSQNLISLGEDILDFEKAWGLEGERKKGKKIPKHILHVPNLYYSEIARYATQIKNVYNYFPEEQVKVIFFDEFKSDTKKIFSEVLTFLNIPELNKVDFLKINENKILKYRFIEKLFQYKPLFTLRVKIKKKLGVKDLKVHRIVAKLNRKKIKRKPLAKIIKNKIITHYMQEVNDLGDLMKKDLSKWNKLEK